MIRTELGARRDKQARERWKTKYMLENVVREFQSLPVLKRWPKKIEMVEMNPTYCNMATLKVILCNGE